MRVATFALVFFFTLCSQTVSANVSDDLLDAAGVTPQNLTIPGVGSVDLATNGPSLGQLLSELRGATTTITDTAQDLLNALRGVTPQATSTATSTAAATATTTTASLNTAETLALIAVLWQQVLALQEQLALLQAEEAGGAVCAIARTLSRGVSGDDVKALQEFLISEGVLDPGLATGFFGELTEAAVQAWQAQEEIVSSGSPEETGWGIVGPQTRDVLARACEV